MVSKENIYDFLEVNGFKQIEEETSDSFGDYHKTFSNDTVQFRFISDRSVEAIEIRSAKPDDKWYDLGFVKLYFCKEKDLTRPMPFSESVAFLLSEFDRIIEMFNPRNSGITKFSLEEMLALRAKQTFPGQFQ